jgi:hypothetical protein
VTLDEAEVRMAFDELPSLPALDRDSMMLRSGAAGPVGRRLLTSGGFTFTRSRGTPAANGAVHQMEVRNRVHLYSSPVGQQLVNPSFRSFHFRLLTTPNQVAGVQQMPTLYLHLVSTLPRACPDRFPECIHEHPDGL